MYEKSPRPTGFGSGAEAGGGSLLSSLPVRSLELGSLLRVCLGSEEGRYEAETAGELAEADIDAGEHEHRKHHDGGEHYEDDRLVPLHRWRGVDRVVANPVTSHDQHASEEAEDDLGQDGSAGFGRERHDDDGNSDVPEPHGREAGGGVAVGRLPGDRARPDREERGHGEVEELELTRRIPEGFEQVCGPSFVNDLGIIIL